MHLPLGNSRTGRARCRLSMTSGDDERLEDCKLSAQRAGCLQGQQ
eukprot:gene16803-biopygen15851